MSSGCWPRLVERAGRLFGLTLAIVSVFAVRAASGAPVAQITEFSSGLNPGSLPYAIAPGPDGNLWFTDAGSTEAIGRISTSGQITEFSSGLNPGSAPSYIASGADGNLWFTDGGSTIAIGRISTSGEITEFSSGLNPGSAPTEIAPGADGNLWFIDRGSTKAIGRISTSGQITEFSSGLNPGSFPVTIAPGTDGNVWFTDVGSTKAIGRITPSGQITEFSSGLNAGSLPEGITPGADGNLWFGDEGSTKAIGRISTSGQITEFSSGLGSQPAYIAPGADGNVWFTQPGSPSAIGRIGSSGQITEFSSGFNPGSLPLQIALGADGNLWFTDEGSTKAIGRIGTGAPASVQTPPTVSGSGQAGSAHSCQGGQWATWSGFAPSVGLFSFDGYRWLRDGAAIAGQSGQSYTPTSGDIGHQLACMITVTYPLPFLVTTSGVSAALTVQPVGGGGGPTGGRPPNSGPPVAGVASVATAGPHASLSIACSGSAGFNCAGTILLTVRERRRGQTVLAIIASRAHRRHKPTTRTVIVNVGRAMFSIPAGRTDTVQVALNATGRHLLATFYSLKVTATFAGVSIPTRTVTFSYPRINTHIFWRDVFTTTDTTFQSLTFEGIPTGARIELSCSGGGCPFVDRIKRPHGHQADLSAWLVGARLAPGTHLVVVITAPNRIGKVLILTIQSGAAPTQSEACEPPGSHGPQRCR